MSRNIERVTYNGISKFPEMKHPFAAGVHKDVTEIKTEDNVIAVKPEVLAVHRRPGKATRFTIFKPVNETQNNQMPDLSSDPIFKPYAREILAEAVDVSDEAWTERMISEVTTEVVMNENETVFLRYKTFGKTSGVDTDLFDVRPKNFYPLIEHAIIENDARAKIDKAEGINESGIHKNRRDNMNI